LMQTNRPQEAIESFRHAVALKPDYYEALNNLGNMLVQQGRVQEGIAQFQEALRLKPDYLETRKNLDTAMAGLDATDASQPSPADQRPDWVDKPSRRVGDSFQISVSTEPFSTRMECEAHIPYALQSAVDQYVELSLDRRWIGWVRLSPDQLRQLVADQWEEIKDYSFGKMAQIHLLVNFDQKAKELISETLSFRIFTDRAAVVGMIFIGLWLFLAAIWGYLKIDLATKGAYRNRLRFAAGFAILVIATMSLLVLGFLA
jgi:tetratricopeptide (TPR) repeat protein